MKVLLTVIAVIFLVAFAALFIWSDFFADTEEFVVEAPEEEKLPEQETDIELPRINLATKDFRYTDGTSHEYRVSDEFEVAVSAEGIGKARFMDVSPDGRLFVPDMVDYLLSREGRVHILEDFNEKTKKFDTRHVYLSGLRGPNSVAFYRDESGRDWLYIALTENLVRYQYTYGDTEPSGEPEVLFDFPNTQSDNAKSVVWHITRTLLFHENKLYISIGSGCNSCEHFEGEMRGMVIVMNPDGTNARVYAEGLRNAVGMTFSGDTMYVTENGADHLGVNAPDDVIYKVEEREHYGWPYCYEVNGVLIEDNTVDWDKPISCETVPLSFSALKPHSAPLGVEYFDEANEVLDNSFLVALHGSFEPNIKSGYQIIRVSKEGEQEVFMDGFQGEDGERFGRPVDFLQWDENSFFFTDDFRGRLYHVYAK